METADPWKRFKLVATSRRVLVFFGLLGAVVGVFNSDHGRYKVPRLNADGLILALIGYAMFYFVAWLVRLLYRLVFDRGGDETVPMRPWGAPPDTGSPSEPE